MIVEMNQAALLITDKKIASVQDLLPILQQVAAAGQELLIIAEAVSYTHLTLPTNREV